MRGAKSLISRLYDSITVLMNHDTQSSEIQDFLLFVILTRTVQEIEWVVEDLRACQKSFRKSNTRYFKIVDIL